MFEPSEITVSDYLNQWYDLYCKPNLKYNTQAGYLRIMEGHLKPRERIILTPEEWQQIIERFPAGSRFHIPLMIGFYTGLRISETFALTWDDIDLENRTLTVSKQVIKRNFGADVRRAVEKTGKKEMLSSWYFTTAKTASSIRTTKFGDTLCQALKQGRASWLKCERRPGPAGSLQHPDHFADLCT